MNPRKESRQSFLFSYNHKYKHEKYKIFFPKTIYFSPIKW